MAWPSEKTFKVFYYPRDFKAGEPIVKVAFVVASNKSEASGYFQRQYAGQFATIQKIEEC